MVRVSETDIPPRENVSYSKETQTFGLEPPEKEGMYLFRYPQLQPHIAPDKVQDGVGGAGVSA